jgi:endonuclease/exonuclease/phosphatase family metal-dependent hydrolase
MKKHFAIILLLMFSITLLAQTDNIKVMTYNIRCGYCEDSSSVNNWSKRKYLVAYMIKNHNPDLIGLQEAEQFQIKDLVEMLDDYNWYGVGRDDGKEKGESTAILFRKRLFILDGEKTLWLSETPEIISKGWDAALNRTITITLLEDMLTSQEFYFLNTHFDHIGEKARAESSKLFINEIDKFDKNVPVILTGDFNYTSSSDGYKIIKSKLFDAMTISEQQSIGGNITFNGFGKEIKSDNKIDFIFVNKNVEVLTHLIDTTTYNGLFPSDHYPVISELRLKKE